MKVAFVLGSLLGVAAVRRELSSSEESKPVTAISVEKRGSSALQMLLSLQGQKVTPDVASTFSGVETTLKTDVEAAIAKGHENAQVSLNGAVDDLASKTAVVVKDRADAEEVHQDIFDCHGEQKDALETLEEQTGIMIENRETEKTECGAVAGKEPFTASFSKISFSCDMSKSTGCATEIAALRKAQTEQIDSITSQEKIKRADHRKQVDSCADAKKKADDQTQTVANADTKLGEKLQECEGLVAQRKKVLCDRLSESLKNKCTSWNSYTSLKDNIAKEEGELSEPDRISEWKATQMSVCLLGKFSNGMNIDANSIAACNSLAVPYAGRFGTLDFKPKKVHELMAEEKFTCQETTLSFAGVWEIPKDPRSSSADYLPNKEKKFTVGVDVTKKSAFDLCESTD